MTRINAKSLKRDTKCQQTQGLNNHEIQHEDMKLIQRDTKRKKIYTKLQRHQLTIKREMTTKRQ